MRLDKLLANEGFGSRKDVKKLIKKGGVHIDGKVVKDSSAHVDPINSEVVVQGIPIEYREYVYIMLNKPQGVLSATKDAKDPCVTDLIDPSYDKFDLFPVGRLDKDTEGLILLTNDGVLNHRLTSPKKNVTKQYYAEINGEVTEQDVEQFKKGITLDDGYVTKPAELIILNSHKDYSEVEVIISEGKFHQIKRMFQALGKEVLYLNRLRIGSLVIDEELPLEGFRELTSEEYEALSMDED
ncbi:pseudouridine synthase [Halalkalibacillus halophilus]|uniref:pseudouridine synthase n=1 Tax=Halalkalibacillus halophilus TaxID=392827 RepID=UPI00040C88B7|nr:pseudouridine synthase [Halalkalibacillus halophilus]